MFAAFRKSLFKGQPYANLGGVRTEESVMRFGGVTGALCYKDITWGKREGKGYTFYPIYDWTFDDDWTYIAQKGCEYNHVYDLMFNYGLPKQNMRVSNLHHETAYRTLFFLQEVERDTYNKLCERLPGISTFSQMQQDVMVKELPEMFGSWKEYRDYLLEHLIRPDLRNEFRKRWTGQDGDDAIYREHVTELMVNDWEGTKNGNFMARRNLVKKIDNGTYTKKYDYREDE